MNTKILLIGLLITGMLTVVKAQGDNIGNQDKQNPAQQLQPRNFVRGVWVDADKNGVCDKFEAYGAPGRGMGPGRGQGTGPLRKSAPGYGIGRRFRGGRGYIAEQTAVAGNRQELPAGQGRGFGPGYGRGLGPGRGAGMTPGGRFYSDENKNGICDHYERNGNNR